MTFASATFICFLPIVFVLYWVLRKPQYQNILLILASYLFYGWWDYRFCALILFSSLVDYFIGWHIYQSNSVKRRRALLLVSVCLNLGLLGIFKYYNFFAENFSALAQQFGWTPSNLTLDLILPVGISFYTFQTLSYTIDIYRGNIRASKNLVNYLAFVSFFPQLVAGPIERASNLLPQFQSRRSFDQKLARAGCRLILWGFFKKVVIADRLGVIVDQVYAAPENFQGPVLAVATIAFAFQIYCDFSAYSDMAIGTAWLFNINLMRNFAYPYFSQSVSEFWRRWHISLSTWFRDYVYIPLGGNRTTSKKRSANLVTTFLISGIWHGAGWHYLVWGGVHGVVVASHRPKIKSARKSDDTSQPSHTPGGERLIPSMRTLFNILITFAIVCFCWVFFRSTSLSDGMLIVRQIGSDCFSMSAWRELVSFFESHSVFKKTVLLTGVFVLVEWIQRRKMCPLDMEDMPLWVRWSVYSAVIWGTLALMMPSEARQFIYFEF